MKEADSGKIEDVKFLINRGLVDINYQNKYGQTILMLAFQYEGRGIYEYINFLLEKGADVNILDGKGKNALIYAIIYNVNILRKLDFVKLLFKYGSKLIPDKNGRTPLIHTVRIASEDIHIKVVKFLLDKGEDINKKDDDGYTALIYSLNNPPLIKLLLDRGADPFVINYGRTALDFCPTDECRDLISKYIWKRLYSRDVETAKRYGKSVLSKDVWELILLNKRQQQLCAKLSSEKNREVLKFFAMELDIPVTPDITKAKLCASISRNLAYGKYYSEASRKYTEQKIQQDIKSIKDVASRFGLDRNKPIDELLKDLSFLLK